MQVAKTIYSTQEAIIISRGKHLLLGLFLMLLFASGLSAQQDPLSFIDSLTNIIVQQDAESDAQKATVITLREQIFLEMKNNRKNLSKEDRTRLLMALRNLETKQEDYVALIPRNDISPTILAYEKKLQAFKDSIRLIQEQLIEAIEEPRNTTRTKEKAVQVLAGIHNEEVLQYLFENERNLRFGTIDPDNFEEEEIRTAMISILEEYLSEGKVNWMIFPFIVKYVKNVGAYEIGLIRELSGYGRNGYLDTWYLLKFMQANMSPAMKTIIESDLRTVKNPEERR